MRRTILFSLFALLTVNVSTDACAQRRGGGAGVGSARGGHRLSRSRAPSSHRFGSAYLPYGSGYPYLPDDSDVMYPDQPPPGPLFDQQPAQFAPPPPPAAQSPVHPVVNEYKWPAKDTASSSSESEPQAFALVLKDGSTLSASAVFASDDGLHYVDLDDRHLRISMSEVNRAATLKLNRARNLDLYLPAAQ